VLKGRPAQRGRPGLPGLQGFGVKGDKGEQGLPGIPGHVLVTQVLSYYNIGYHGILSLRGLVITCRSRHSRDEMYICHGRLCVCVSVCPSPHSRTTERTRM